MSQFNQENSTGGVFGEVQESSIGHLGSSSGLIRRQETIRLFGYDIVYQEFGAINEGVEAPNPQANSVVRNNNQNRRNDARNRRVIRNHLPRRIPRMQFYLKYIFALPCSLGNHFVAIALAFGISISRNMSGNADSVVTSLSAEQVRLVTLKEEVLRALSHMLNGGNVQLEEIFLHDQPVMMSIIEEQDKINDDMQISLAFEVLTILEDQINNLEVGLTEEEISTHIGSDIFQTIVEGSSHNEICSICQDEYMNGEKVGKLDCGHKFHLGCIRQWLLLKNICPICKRIALDDEYN